MSRHRTPKHGDGTAWLVVDRARGDYSCSWFAGTHDGRLVEHARIATASEAVAWGRSRTARVRIRTADACTYWAGTAPRPEGFSHSWTEPNTTDVSQPGDNTEFRLEAGPANGTIDEPRGPGGSPC